MHRLVSVALVALLVAGCSASARSPKRSGSSRPQVVLLDIDGAAEPVQKRIEELAARRFEVIAADAYWDAARRLKAKKLSRRNIAKVATDLGAIAVIHGKASGGKRRQVVTIYVRDAESGKLLERYRLTVKNGKIAKKGKRQLDRKLLARVKGPSPDQPAAAEEPGEEATASTEGGGKEGGKEADKTAAADEEEEEPPLPPVKYDDSGQAVDDELPPM